MKELCCYIYQKRPLLLRPYDSQKIENRYGDVMAKTIPPLLHQNNSSFQACVRIPLPVLSGKETMGVIHQRFLGDAKEFHRSQPVFAPRKAYG